MGHGSTMNRLVLSENWSAVDSGCRSRWTPDIYTAADIQCTSARDDTMLQVTVSEARERDRILLHKCDLFVCVRIYLRYSPSNMYYPDTPENIWLTTLDPLYHWWCASERPYKSKHICFQFRQGNDIALYQALDYRWFELCLIATLPLRCGLVEAPIAFLYILQPWHLGNSWIIQDFK